MGEVLLGFSFFAAPVKQISQHFQLSWTEVTLFIIIIISSKKLPPHNKQQVTEAKPVIIRGLFSLSLLLIM